MRIVLGIEYNGSHYHGWAHQNGLATIQGYLEQAISSIADHQVKLHCAGRTDTAVHATYQVAHFDTTAMRKTQAWVQGTNSLLPPDIRITWAKNVDDEFHARFSAIKRQYHYLIYNHSVPSAIFSKQVSWVHYPLNHHDMALAANFLIGEHDFSSFRSSECQSNSPMRHVSQVDVYKKGPLLGIGVCIDLCKQVNIRLHTDSFNIRHSERITKSG